MVEPLPSMNKALGLIPAALKNFKKKIFLKRRDKSIFYEYFLLSKNKCQPGAGGSHLSS
jgi:hypothetical protein